MRSYDNWLADSPDPGTVADREDELMICAKCGGDCVKEDYDAVLRLWVCIYCVDRRNDGPADWEVERGE